MIRARSLGSSQNDTPEIGSPTRFGLNSPTKIPVMLSRTGSLKMQKPILEPLR